MTLSAHQYWRVTRLMESLSDERQTELFLKLALFSAALRNSLERLFPGSVNRLIGEMDAGIDLEILLQAIVDDVDEIESMKGRVN